MNAAATTAYRNSAACRPVWKTQKGEKAQKTCGFRAIGTYGLCIKDNVLIDPCCGTAGFLLAAYEHMRTQSRDVEKQKFLKNNALFGADNTDLVVTLASMNLYLHDIGVEQSPIVHQDSLIETSDRLYKVVMTIILSRRLSGTIPYPSIASKIVRISESLSRLKCTFHDH